MDKFYLRLAPYKRADFQHERQNSLQRVSITIIPFTHQQNVCFQDPKESAKPRERSYILLRRASRLSYAKMISCTDPVAFLPTFLEKKSNYLPKMTSSNLHIRDVNIYNKRIKAGEH